MKASDYASEFTSKGCTMEALKGTIMAMLKEVVEISRARHARNDDTMIPILNEMDQKFLSFWKLVGGKLSNGFAIHPQAFRRVIQDKFSDVFYVWNRRRGGRLVEA